MSTENVAKEPAKKATRISMEAHDLLKEYCERTGRTQVDVLTDLTLRFVKPELDRLLAAKQKG